MPNFRRRYRPGGTYFFTQVADQRRPILTSDLGRRVLRQAIEATRNRWPFEIEAWVLLPDHLHAIWKLPPEDDDYSRRWAFLKKEFTKAYLTAGGEEAPVTPGRARDGRRGVWQPKFWEHTIRDQRDYERHFHYLHFNPVKHGLVEMLCEYPYSTFHRHVRAGVYQPDWASWESGREPFDFDGLDIASIECDAFGE
jgi:putative transposase